MKNHLRCSFVIFAGMTFATVAVAQHDAPNAVPAPTATTQTGTTNADDKGAVPKATTRDFNDPVYHVDGSIVAPVATYTPIPEVPAEALGKKFSGSVIVGLIVDADGNSKNVRVLRSLGDGFDRKAVEAVQQYKFKPALKNGVPVAVYLKVEVSFQIF